MTLKKCCKNKKGVALTYAVMVLFLLATVIVGITALASSSFSEAVLVASDDQAYFYAKSVGLAMKEQFTDSYNIDKILTKLDEQVANNYFDGVEGKYYIRDKDQNYMTEASVRITYPTYLDASNQRQVSSRKVLEVRVACVYNNALSVVTSIFSCESDADAKESNLAIAYSNYDVILTNKSGINLDFLSVSKGKKDNGGDRPVDVYAYFGDNSNLSLPYGMKMNGNLTTSGPTNITGGELVGSLTVYGNLTLTRSNIGDDVHVDGDVLLNPGTYQNKTSVSAVSTTETGAHNIYARGDITIKTAGERLHYGNVDSTGTHNPGDYSAVAGKEPSHQARDLIALGNVTLEPYALIFGDIYAQGNVEVKGATYSSATTINGVPLATGTPVQYGNTWVGDIDNNKKTYGNIYAKGDVTINNGAVVRGSVYAGGNVTISNGAVVIGDVEAQGNVTINTGFVGRSVNCVGMLTLQSQSGETNARKLFEAKDAFGGSYKFGCGIIGGFPTIAKDHSCDKLVLSNTGNIVRIGRKDIYVNGKGNSDGYTYLYSVIIDKTIYLEDSRALFSNKNSATAPSAASIIGGIRQKLDFYYGEVSAGAPRTGTGEAYNFVRLHNTKIGTLEAGSRTDPRDVYITGGTITEKLVARCAELKQVTVIKGTETGAPDPSLNIAQFLILSGTSSNPTVIHSGNVNVACEKVSYKGKFNKVTNYGLTLTDYAKLLGTTVTYVGSLNNTSGKVKLGSSTSGNVVAAGKIEAHVKEFSIAGYTQLKEGSTSACIKAVAENFIVNSTTVNDAYRKDSTVDLYGELMLDGALGNVNHYKGVFKNGESGKILGTYKSNAAVTFEIQVAMTVNSDFQINGTFDNTKSKTLTVKGNLFIGSLSSNTLNDVKVTGDVQINGVDESTSPLIIAGSVEVGGRVIYRNSEGIIINSAANVGGVDCEKLTVEGNVNGCDKNSYISGEFNVTGGTVKNCTVRCGSFTQSGGTLNKVKVHVADSGTSATISGGNGVESSVWLETGSFSMKGGSYDANSTVTSNKGSVTIEPINASDTTITATFNGTIWAQNKVKIGKGEADGDSANVIVNGTFGSVVSNAGAVFLYAKEVRVGVYAKTNVTVKVSDGFATGGNASKTDYGIKIKDANGWAKLSSTKKDTIFKGTYDIPGKLTLESDLTFNACVKCADLDGIGCVQENGNINERGIRGATLSLQITGASATPFKLTKSLAKDDTGKTGNITTEQRGLTIEAGKEVSGIIYVGAGVYTYGSSTEKLHSIGGLYCLNNPVSNEFLAGSIELPNVTTLNLSGSMKNLKADKLEKINIDRSFEGSLNLSEVPEAEIKAGIELKGNLIVDKAIVKNYGTVTGGIKCDTLTNTGTISNGALCTTLTNSGTISGGIKCTTKLTNSGTIKGNVDCTTLINNSGKTVTGNVKCTTLKNFGTIKGSVSCTNYSDSDTSILQKNVDDDYLFINSGATITSANVSVNIYCNGKLILNENEESKARENFGAKNGFIYSTGNIIVYYVSFNSEFDYIMALGDIDLQNCKKLPNIRNAGGKTKFTNTQSFAGTIQSVWVSDKGKALQFGSNPSDNYQTVTGTVQWAGTMAKEDDVGVCMYSTHTDFKGNVTFNGTGSVMLSGKFEKDLYLYNKTTTEMSLGCEVQGNLIINSYNDSGNSVRISKFTIAAGSSVAKGVYFYGNGNTLKLLISGAVKDVHIDRANAYIMGPVSGNVTHTSSVDGYAVHLGYDSSYSSYYAKTVDGNVSVQGALYVKSKGADTFTINGTVKCNALSVNTTSDLTKKQTTYISSDLTDATAKKKRTKVAFNDYVYVSAGKGFKGVAYCSNSRFNMRLETDGQVCLNYCYFQSKNYPDTTYGSNGKHCAAKDGNNVSGDGSLFGHCKKDSWGDNYFYAVRTKSNVSLINGVTYLKGGNANPDETTMDGALYGNQKAGVSGDRATTLFYFGEGLVMVQYAYIASSPKAAQTDEEEKNEKYTASNRTTAARTIVWIGAGNLELQAVSCRIGPDPSKCGTRKSKSSHPGVFVTSGNVTTYGTITLDLMVSGNLSIKKGGKVGGCNSTHDACVYRVGGNITEEKEGENKVAWFDNWASSSSYQQSGVGSGGSYYTPYGSDYRNYMAGKGLYGSSKDSVTAGTSGTLYKYYTPKSSNTIENGNKPADLASGDKKTITSSTNNAPTLKTLSGVTLSFTGGDGAGTAEVPKQSVPNSTFSSTKPSSITPLPSRYVLDSPKDMPEIENTIAYSPSWASLSAKIDSFKLDYSYNNLTLNWEKSSYVLHMDTSKEEWWKPRVMPYAWQMPMNYIDSNGQVTHTPVQGTQEKPKLSQKTIAPAYDEGWTYLEMGTIHNRSYKTSSGYNASTEKGSLKWFNENKLIGADSARHDSTGLYDYVKRVRDTRILTNNSPRVTDLLVFESGILPEKAFYYEYNYGDKGTKDKRNYTRWSKTGGGEGGDYYTDKLLYKFSSLASGILSVFSGKVSDYKKEFLAAYKSIIPYSNLNGDRYKSVDAYYWGSVQKTYEGLIDGFKTERAHKINLLFYACKDPTNPYGEGSEAKDLHIVLPEGLGLEFFEDSANKVLVIGKGRVFLYLTSGDTIYFRGTAGTGWTVGGLGDDGLPQLYFIGAGTNIDLVVENMNLIAYVYMPFGEYGSLYNKTNGSLKYTTIDGKKMSYNEKDFIVQKNILTLAGTERRIYGTIVTDKLTLLETENKYFYFYRKNMKLGKSTIYNSSSYENGKVKIGDWSVDVDLSSYLADPPGISNTMLNWVYSGMKVVH